MLGKDELSNGVAWTFVIVMATYVIAMLIEVFRWLYYEIKYKGDK